jgi:non-ribosomal peptide synthetase component F
MSVPDPFAPRSRPGGASAEDGDARLHRTGDLGRINTEDTLKFLGRADAQVKLRGSNVALLHLSHQVVARPNAECHNRQRWVLAGAGREP